MSSAAGDDDEKNLGLTLSPSFPQPFCSNMSSTLRASIPSKVSQLVLLTPKSHPLQVELHSAVEKYS